MEMRQTVRRQDMHKLCVKISAKRNVIVFLLR